MSTNILQDVADYYSSRIRAHGATLRGGLEQ